MDSEDTLQTAGWWENIMDTIVYKKKTNLQIDVMFYSV